MILYENYLFYANIYKYHINLTLKYLTCPYLFNFHITLRKTLFTPRPTYENSIFPLIVSPQSLTLLQNWIF